MKLRSHISKTYLRNLAQKIAESLFTDADGNVCNRLVVEPKDNTTSVKWGTGPGWGKAPMGDRIGDHLIESLSKPKPGRKSK